jgi:hypothetical protein
MWFRRNESEIVSEKLRGIAFCALIKLFIAIIN